MGVRSRNQVTVTGRAGGPVVVPAHGFGCDQHMWRLVVPLLERDFTVLLVDHVGAGRSDLSAWSPERCSTLDGYTEDVLEICHEQALAPSPCFVDDPATGYRGGFSAADIDELLGSLDANHLGWSAAMAPVIMGNPERPELGEDLADVTVPTLVAQCSRDAIAPPEVGESVRSRIRGSRLVTLNATGHCPQLAAPQETAAAITGFVGAVRR
ncbi:alpha/beta hydrolase [Streptomyces sp. W16]|uniref:alpha/beta fold hydrolase n=1 Tax=Streptomyces sp. W16 TaxID=3076631 RepID=UPI00295AE54B|nr:alpha/beta hydrolase [Streptomyces sp. W16]MDV9175825.1 alpha/beta hydrolase [Streptomyces sp. W16]